eukprot:TRINITY_DN28859_c0_g1_i1.p1 TRINITY_DN28859_c0_g1~~TRINITY_DN28859_c0_g1_i1.p1  ORF type:complete len:200 (-),score=30.39 TRINITY_DN28859_c0_g1_i1:135-734(-)
MFEHTAVGANVKASADDSAGSSNSSLRSHVVFSSGPSSGEQQSSKQTPDDSGKECEASEADAEGFPEQTLKLQVAQECTPCYYMGLGNCRKGDACRFCHFPHERKPKARPRKTKRELIKNEINDLHIDCVHSPEEFLEKVRRIVHSARRGDFSLLVLKSKLNVMAASEEADVARLANVALESIVGNDETVSAAKTPLSL